MSLIDQLTDKDVIEISIYSRQIAIEDGTLIDCSEAAKEAGFKYPVALTKSVWIDCVEWPSDLYLQDEDGRLWDVLYMAFMAIKQSKSAGSELLYSLYRIPANSINGESELVTLKLIVGPGDKGEPVITIMMINED